MSCCAAAAVITPTSSVSVIQLLKYHRPLIGDATTRLMDAIDTIIHHQALKHHWQSIRQLWNTVFVHLRYVVAVYGFLSWWLHFTRWGKSRCVLANVFKYRFFLFCLFFNSLQNCNGNLCSVAETIHAVLNRKATCDLISCFHGRWST